MDGWVWEINNTPDLFDSDEGPTDLPASSCSRDSRYSGCRSSHSRRRFWTRIRAEWAGDLGGRGCGLAYASPDIGIGGDGDCCCCAAGPSSVACAIILWEFILQ